MLLRFLRATERSPFQSLQDIARALEISPAMALEIAAELRRLGYLQEICPDGDAPTVACSECPVSHGCLPRPRSWALTDKGIAVLRA